jgi:hypothetical protein
MMRLEKVAVEDFTVPKWQLSTSLFLIGS